MKKFLSIALATMAISAQATTSLASTAVLSASIPVETNVTVSGTPVISLTVGSDGKISAASVSGITFDLFNNLVSTATTKSTVRVTSTNGNLLPSGVTDGSPTVKGEDNSTFDNFIAYKATGSVVLAGAGLTGADLSYDITDAAPEPAGQNIGLVNIDGGTVTVNLSTTGSNPIVAGTYTDTLNFTITKGSI